jgi:hypothetical protein
MATRYKRPSARKVFTARAWVHYSYFGLVAYLEEDGLQAADRLAAAIELATRRACWLLVELESASRRRIELEPPLIRRNRETLASWPESEADEFLVATAQVLLNHHDGPLVAATKLKAVVGRIRSDVLRQQLDDPKGGRIGRSA